MAHRPQVIDLGYHPRRWQRECHLKRKRFTILVLHRRAGKTELALRELLDQALRNTEDLPLYFYVAPQLKQAKAIAWARLKQIVAPMVEQGLCEINESELWVRLLTNDAMIRIYGADNPDAMRGVRLDGAVLDEVAQMKPEVWDEIVQPALADRLGWALFIGTPKGVNLFSELYFKAQTLPDWHTALYTVYDTDALNPTEVERLRGAMTETAWRREMLCDFSASGDDQLISLFDVDEAARRFLRPDQYNFSPIIIGVDPARFGDDNSVIAIRQGLKAWEPRVYPKRDNMTLAGLVAQCADEVHANAIFVDEGNGGGVIDRLRQLGRDVTGVHFGGKSPKPRYSNMRTFMWWEMREWLEGGGAIPRNTALMQDMASPLYSFERASDRIILEPKDDIKKRIGRSPDLGDALALTFAYPVTLPDGVLAAARAMGLPVREPTPLDYDPYAGM